LKQNQAKEGMFFDKGSRLSARVFGPILSPTGHSLLVAAMNWTPVT